jgi:ferredoxin-NADP reductase
MSINPRTHTIPAVNWLHSAWLRPFNDRAALDELMQRLMPRAALGDIRALVEEIIDETADTRSFVLRANRNWPGFRAGQHVLVTMDVRGRRLQRCFSLSSAPASDRRLTITVKRQRPSGITAWMHTELRVGSIVTLSRPFGDFQLPDRVPERLLMLSAGSGITPLMSMLRSLFKQKYSGDIVFVHTCRQPADGIFADELRAMADRWPTLRLHLHYSHGAGRLDAQRLTDLVPDFAARSSLLCGPTPFSAWVHALYQQRGAADRLRSEQFGLQPAETASTATGGGTVHCDVSKHSFTALPGQPLLLAAEAAGLAPRHGCRMGICRTCQCRKHVGTVENLLTGEVCAEPGQLIQLCISAARSPLTLEL